MMKAGLTFALVLSAGLALSACGGDATSTPSASVSSMPTNRQAAPVSSDVSSASAVPSSVAGSADSVDAGGYSSPAPGEQAQTDGPAMGIRKATTMCVENLSSVTPVVTFTTYEEQAGQGPMKYRARACATGYSGWKRDIVGRLEVPTPNEQMMFWANNFPVGSPDAGLEQERYGECVNYVGYSVGDRRTWDDGILMYVMERESDGVNKVFRLTIRDSANGSADRKPAKCPTYGR